jgi:GntR family transcriptional regulator, sialic acid-inducible nan operon repressor
MMSMNDVDPIPRRKLYQEVVERLLERIARGDYPPGDQLPSERQLMQMFQVGRPAVREALLTLERMGLIAISHGERARVQAPTAQTIIGQIAGSARQFLTGSPGNLEHLKEARVFFETGVVRIAAVKADAEGIARLERALEAQRRVAVTDTSLFLSKDMAFHRAIAQMTGNPIYVALVPAMFSWLAEFHAEMVRLPGAERLTIEEHTAILEAIRARDRKAAESAMTAHLTRANDLYRIYEQDAPRGRSPDPLFPD